MELKSKFILDLTEDINKDKLSLNELISNKSKLEKTIEIEENKNKKEGENRVKNSNLELKEHDPQSNKLSKLNINEIKNKINSSINNENENDIKEKKKLRGLMVIGNMISHLNSAKKQIENNSFLFKKREDMETKALIKNREELQIPINDSLFILNEKINQINSEIEELKKCILNKEIELQSAINKANAEYLETVTEPKIKWKPFKLNEKIRKILNKI